MSAKKAGLQGFTPTIMIMVKLCNVCLQICRSTEKRHPMSISFPALFTSIPVSVSVQDTPGDFLNGFTAMNASHGILGLVTDEFRDDAHSRFTVNHLLTMLLLLPGGRRVFYYPTILVWSLVLASLCHGDGTNGDLGTACGLPTDPCMTESLWTKCRSLEEGGCRTILVQERCPLQFTCGDVENDDDDEADVCGLSSDPCMNEENWAECRALVTSGCPSIMQQESCPLKFACEGNATTSSITDDDSQASSGTTTSNNKSSSVCGLPTDPCMNENNWADCQILESSGCSNIVAMESCPLQFSCSDDDGSSGGGGGGGMNTEPNACVTFQVYNNGYCDDKVLRTLSFSTWSTPGSPCSTLPSASLSSGSTIQ